MMTYQYKLFEMSGQGDTGAIAYFSKGDRGTLEVCDEQTASFYMTKQQFVPGQNAGRSPRSGDRDSASIWLRPKASTPAVSDEAAIGDDPEARGDSYIGSRQ